MTSKTLWTANYYIQWMSLIVIALGPSITINFISYRGRWKTSWTAQPKPSTTFNPPQLLYRRAKKNITSSAAKQSVLKEVARWPKTSIRYWSDSSDLNRKPLWYFMNNLLHQGRYEKQKSGRRIQISGW